MATSIAMSDVQVLGVGATVDIRPNVGEDWEITLIGDSRRIGVQPNQVPDLNLSIIDAGGVVSEVLRGVDLAHWLSEQTLPISRDNWLRITNLGAGCNISWSAELIMEYGAGLSIVRTDTQAIAANAALRVRPPVGEDWMITAVGSNQWIGALPAGQPDVRVDMMDGTDIAVMMQSTEARYWEFPLEIYVTNDTWIDIINTSLVQAQVSFTAKVIREFGAGNSIVRSRLAQCAALGTQDFQPNAGENWKVTQFGAAGWWGVSPLMFPDVNMGMWDGTVNALIADRTNWKSHGHRTKCVINNANYLRATDTSNAINDVGISAVLIRQYA